MTELLDGHYKAENHFYKILKVEGGKTECDDGSGTMYPMKIKYGDFGEADPVIEEKAGGIKTYNIKLILSIVPSSEEEEKEEEGDEELKKGQFVNLGILYDEGRQVAMKGTTGVATLIKITEEELEEILNDCDPIEAPPGEYKIQPEKAGKIVWLSGAPGMGKSTSAQILGRDHGYVYYEADCFGGLKNPYVPLNVDNPTMAQIRQKNLKGPGAEERKAMIQRVMTVWGDMMAGKEYDKELMMEYFEHLALDIKREKKRIGGNFAIATVVFDRQGRDHLRKFLGSDLIIVNLSMSMEERRARVLQRHSGDEISADLMDDFANMMKRIEEGEPNSIQVEVTGSMSRAEVVEEILRQIGELETRTNRQWGDHLVHNKY